MPNWCFANYVIEGDKEEVKDLAEKLMSLEKSKHPVKNDFGTNWLGNAVTLFGGDHTKISCRGDFSDLEYIEGDNKLTFNVEAAWDEKADVWKFVCDKYTSLRYYFYSEETGNGHYATNDREGKYFTDRFVLQMKEGTEYFETKRSLFEYVSEYTGIKVSSIEQVEDALSSYPTDSCDCGAPCFYTIEVE
ncbi:MAG: hypothetical protein LBM08_00735 [Dysgonamonadaceae bacterium]|jgi:hypothetical protein|nr:hypothetical protein [Dysgonamonadaceae bacterium]